MSGSLFMSSIMNSRRDVVKGHDALFIIYSEYRWIENCTM
jgi:hypothetical protein